MFLIVIIPFLNVAIHHRPAAAAEGNSSEDDEEWQEKPLIFAWIEKPPYATLPSNGSSDNEAHGMIREALIRHVTVECGWYAGIGYEMTTLKVDSEFGMIELLRQNKVHVALPIFEHPSNRRYSEFPFVKLDDYPGSEYITTEDDTSTLSIVLDAVLKAWPLLAVTMVITAIAGIIMWALVSKNCPKRYGHSSAHCPASLVHPYVALTKTRTGI